MSPTIRNQAKLAGAALAAGLALTAFGAGDARAQSFNVKQFDCVDGDTIKLDISGLGSQTSALTAPSIWTCSAPA
jgi:hypothetical protein